MNKIAIGENIEIEVLNSKGKFKKSWGKTKQTTSTTGKNKLDQTLIEKKKSGNNFTIEQQTDKSIRCYGTASVTSEWIFELQNPIILKPGTYTFSPTIINNITANPSMSCRLLKSSNNATNKNSFGGTCAVISNNSFIRATITETTTFTHLFLYTNANYETDIVVNFQVESGNSKSAFEQFIPTMPSPNYPSRIRNLGDNVNIFDLNSYFENSVTVRCTKELLDNGIRLKFTAGADTYLNEAIGKGGTVKEGTKDSCIKVKPNTTYTLKMSSSPKCYISYLDKNYKSFGYSLITKQAYTFTTNSSTYYIYLRLGYQSNSSGLTSYDFTDIKLEEGSTATPYTPYGCGSIDYEINTTQNIFNKDTDIELDGQYRSYVTGNIATNQNYYGVKVKVEGNKEYKVFSYQNYSNLCYFDKNMTYISGEIFGKDSYNYIFSTPQNCEYITLAVAKNGINEFSITEVKTIHFPLSKGQLLHEGDYIDSTGIYIKRDKYTFSINDDWQQTNNKKAGCFTLYKPNPSKEPSLTYIPYCTNLIGVMNNNYEKTNVPNSIGISADRFNVYIPSATSVDECKSIMANQTVEYKLKEEVITPLTAEQLLAYDQMDGVVLYNGKNYITTINELKPKIEFLYEIRNIKDEQIYVLNKNEELIAVFNRDDEDTIFNPRIKDTQNAESVFTFSISPNNPKWEEIKDPENLYLVDNKIYSTNFEGCFQETISDNNEDYILVTAYERQKLLTRKYVRAWNSETGFEAIDTFMVVVLSNGNLPLKNNNVLVNSSHLPGTSGYALDALLYGTGWKTGICDVEGTFDLETDQVDIYENILKIQQIWGGILVFDSVNKIVHHRDETKYLPYNGYEVRYRKNMQSLEKLYNNKIVTRLCPLGEGGLNIKSVNNGSEWLTNFSYTDSVLEGIENNPDILDSTQLKAWGERKLKDLCKPRKELTVQAILLYQVEGYELETIELNHIVDVINFANIDGDIEQLRVVSFDYGVWDYSDAVLELSDITLESTDIFKKTVSASNSINNGTLNSNKVVNFFKNGQSISTTFKNIDETIEKTTSQLSKSDEEINGKIIKMTTDIDSISGAVENQVKEIDNLKLTVQGLINQYSISGGNNLIRNSVGFFGNEFWEGTIVKDTDTDVKINNESKCGFKLQSGNAAQSVNQLKNGVYNISFNYKKILTAANIKVYINEESYDLTNTDWTSFEKVITITNNKFTIKFNTDTNNSCIISDLLLIAGQSKQTWSQNANETSTDTVQIGKGIQVESDATNTYTRIDSDGNRTFSSITGLPVMEATKDGMAAETIVVRTKAEIVGLLYQKIEDQVFENLL